MAESPMYSEEHVLKIEAKAAIREIAFAVKYVEFSKTLPESEELVYLNLTTKEDASYCVELTASGFRIVGKKFDVIETTENMSRFYETIYQLLDTVSPEYRNTFGDALTEKLKKLQNIEEKY